MLRTRRRLLIARLALAWVVLAPALAQPALAAEPVGDDGQPIKPNLGVRFTYDSNIYDTSTDEIAAWIGVVSPAILLSTEQGKKRFSLLYTGEYGYFFEDSTDNYADHLLGGAAQFQPGSRGQFELAAATERRHFDRGSDQTDGFGPTSPFFPPEPDVFERQKWAGTFRYGAEGNRGRLNFSAGGSQLEFTNNRARTRFFDYDTLFGSAGLSLLFHQRTAVVFDVVYTDIRYPSTRPGEASRGGNDWRYLLGLTWEATAKTSGSLRVGVQRRRFDDPSRPNTSNPSWEAEVRWSPREYSYFEFETSRVNQETFGDGAFIDSRGYGLTWTHEWRKGWQSIVNWSMSYAEFIDSVRDQDLSRVYLGLRYASGRLLTWEAGFSRRSRDSSLSRLVYDGNMFSIGLNVGT